ncbi:MAG: hypothetical protein HY077_13920 [Elusimicrobia bacterium]|nr:hypothetical protein [Elusimicrobiota bacterium]
MSHIFFVPASGTEAAAHYRDTILRRRSLAEIAPFLSASEARDLQKIYKGDAMAIWGALPGPSSVRNWRAMQPGDNILFYRSGRFVCIGEIAHKFQNAKLAEHLWGKSSTGTTWEHVYFITNEQHIKASLEDFNQLFGFKSNFRPQGFAQILKGRQQVFERHYGLVYDVMIRLDRGEKIREKPDASAGYKLLVDTHSLSLDSAPLGETERVPSPHTEIQWRLLKMGLTSKNEVWVARNDRTKQFDGVELSEGALETLPNLGLDPETTKTVELIDTLWLKGRRVSSAFEIENSTSIYSGLLRLADLKTQAPNLTFPLYIVAPDERRDDVFRQMKRPTFAAISVTSSTRYLPYSRIRDLDDNYVAKNLPVTPDLLSSVAEAVH